MGDLLAGVITHLELAETLVAALSVLKLAASDGTRSLAGAACCCCIGLSKQVSLGCQLVQLLTYPSFARSESMNVELVERGCAETLMKVLRRHSNDLAIVEATVGT